MKSLIGSMAVLWLLSIDTVAQGPESNPPPSVTHWDARFEIVVKGYLAPDNPNFETKIELRGSRNSRQYFAQVPGVSGSVVIPGKDFQYDFQTFWGGELREGDPSPPGPEFLVAFDDAEGKCARFVMSPTERDYMHGGMTVNLGDVVLGSVCKPVAVIGENLPE